METNSKSPVQGANGKGRKLKKIKVVKFGDLKIKRVLQHSFKRVFIMDNGSNAIKAGYSTDESPRIIPNCIHKVAELEASYVGDNINICSDPSKASCQYSCERGIITDWHVQKEVWKYIFNIFDIQFDDTCLIMTEPPFNFLNANETAVDVMLNEFKFHSLYICNATNLSAYYYQQQSLEKLPNFNVVIVDSGFASTYIIPFVNAKRQDFACVRIDVGGQLLTNHLKNVISYRQFNVDKVPYVVNQIKEDVCFVADDFSKAMKQCKDGGEDCELLQYYILPDFFNKRRGSIISKAMLSELKDHEQVLKLKNERFQIPELLFHPSDVNINQKGIPEVIVESAERFPECVKDSLYYNVLLTGGNVLFRGFQERIQNELRSLVDDLCEVRVIMPKNPITYAWEGAVQFSRDKCFQSLLRYREGNRHISRNSAENKVTENVEIQVTDSAEQEGRENVEELLTESAEQRLTECTEEEQMIVDVVDVLREHIQ